MLARSGQCWLSLSGRAFTSIQTAAGSGDAEGWSLVGMLAGGAPPLDGVTALVTAAVPPLPELIGPAGIVPGTSLLHADTVKNASHETSRTAALGAAAAERGNCISPPVLMILWPITRCRSSQDLRTFWPELVMQEWWR